MPMPSKLVQKVQELQYVDMKEFLPHNITLICKTELWEQLPRHPSGSHLCLREVTSILYWVTCFITYVVVLAEAHPNGWCTYDHILCQNAAEDQTIDREKLDHSLHAAT